MPSICHSKYSSHFYCDVTMLVHWSAVILGGNVWGGVCVT
jgi:hypothetical protein